MHGKDDRHPDADIVHRGQWGSVEYAVCANGDRLAENFILSLKLPDRQKIANLFVFISETGMIKNREKFKKVERKIWEFKCHQIRIGCFQVERRWILTHGFIKKQDKWPSSELIRAERVMAEHIGR